MSRLGTAKDVKINVKINIVFSKYIRDGAEYPEISGRKEKSNYYLK